MIPLHKLNEAPIGTRVMTGGIIVFGALWWVKGEPVKGIAWRGEWNEKCEIGTGLLSRLAIKMEEPDETST